MKKGSGIFLLLLFVSQLCFAGIQDSSDQSEPSYVYFFRLPNFAGSAAKMTILSNDKPIVRLRNASFFKYETQPGDYLFSFDFGSSSKVNLKVESGKNYYIKCYYNMGFWSGIPIFELVDPNSGSSIIDGNELTAQSNEIISVKERNSRIGITLSGGFGFENFAWFIDEGGNDVNLSTGGGFGIGAEYGHQFGKKFDLSVNWFFQGSSLSERLKNASASFNRMGIAITPALVIPIKGGDILRFRLGAGPGLYSMGSMKIDGSEIDGTILNFKYKPAVGIHGLFLFESKIMERGSMNLGIRYSNIHYKIDAGGIPNGISEQEIIKPDGSGIDFLLGYHLIF